MLYLLKSSRVHEYHHQNVAIVGSAESERFTITYGEKWVAPGVQMKEGDGCVILLSDTPYEYFVPVRFGVLEAVDREESRLRLDVRMTAPVRAGGTAKINALLSMYESDDPDRPGKRFVFEAENPGLESPQSDSDRDTAWVEIIDNLRRNGYFERTTFTRVLRVVDDNGRPLEPGRPITVGQEFVAEIEARTPSDGIDSISLYMETEPDGAVQHDDVGAQPPSGIVRLPFRVNVPGLVKATVRILPEPTKSSRSVIEMIAESPAVSTTAHPRVESTAATDELPSPRSQDLTPIVRFLDREATLKPETWRSLGELLLREYNPTDPAVLSRSATAAFELGRFDECVRLLRSIVARRPAEERLLVIAALRGGIDVNFEDLLPRMDIEKESDFLAVVDALVTVDRAVVERVTKILDSEVLGDERRSRLVERVFPVINNFELATHLADRVAYIEPALGAQMLFDRWPPEKAPERAVDLLLDWEFGGNRLTPYFLRRVTTLASAARWAEVDGLVDSARRVLIGRDRFTVCRAIGEVLFESGAPAFVDRGFDLLVESINADLADGNFESATELAQQLLGHAMVQGDEARRMVASDLLDLTLASAIESPEYVAWHRYVTASAADRLRTKVNGRSLHVVGGQECEWLGELRDELRLSDARWHATEKHGGVNLDWVDGLNGDRDVVIVVTWYIGHAISTPLKERCSRKGVSRLEARPTKKEFLDVLERHYGTGPR